VRRREKPLESEDGAPPQSLLRYQPSVYQPQSGVGATPWLWDADAFAVWLRDRARWREQSDVPLPHMYSMDRFYAHTTAELPADVVAAEDAAPKADPHRRNA
jgi:hypothetical protein